jgi:hypothetical protein
MKLYHPDIYKYVTWYNRTTSHQLPFKTLDGRKFSIELAKHGDKCYDGMRGTINTVEKSFGYATVGHSHAPKILRGLWYAGTISRKDLPYKGGESTTKWFDCNISHYENGQRQMLISVTDKNKKVRWCMK